MGEIARLVCFVSWTGMQITILLTGNYTFLNYNSIAVSLFLIDDRMLGWIFPGLVSAGTAVSAAFVSQPPRLFLELAIAGLTLPIGIIQFLTYLDLPRKSIPNFVTIMHAATKHFRSVNTYALFASMTHQRKEIFFEGSDDGGVTWREYQFKWQPQKLDRRPRFMAPHLPRFDWNLWFAAQDRLGVYPLVVRAGEALMAGEPAVLKLFRDNPFPNRPPDKMRFPLYEYSFTSMSDWRETGAWWKRKEAGFYCSMLTRSEPFVENREIFE
jgi:hypothetical protein